MFKLKQILIGIFLGALFIGAPMVFGQDNQVAAPRVLDTRPTFTEELPLQSPVLFIFDRPMDTNHPDNTFQIQPNLGGEWTWDEDGRVLTYTPPTDGYTRNTSYQFDVFAIDVDGLAMSEPFQLTLKTVGFLEVVDVIPAPETNEIEVDSDVTIIFNRPVVPLSSIAEQPNYPAPLTFFPEAVGTGRWINASIYTFSPNPAFSGGTQYQVVVNSGLEGADGAILNEDYVFSFTTALPIVENVTVTNSETAIALDPTFTVNFSQPMDRNTQNGIRLIGTNGEAVNLTYQWASDTRSVNVAPVELLQYGRLYDFQVDRTIMKTISGTPLAEDYSSSYLTVPYPDILRTEPSNGEQNAEPFGGFRIYFNAPVDPNTIKDNVIIDPEPFQIYDEYYYSYDNSYGIFFDLEPSTTYTVRILAGIKDIYGSPINEERVITFTTAPYGPEVTLNAPDFVGLYNGLADSTRIFVTHRNVSQLDLQLSRLDVELLGQMFGPSGYQMRYDYTPSSERIIRAWTVPVQSQLNQRRYELLFLSEQGPSGVENIQCLGAPPTRLAVGATAEVSRDDASPNRVRNAPNLGGGIIGEYAPGTTFQVLNGPICADGYLWWEIYNPNDNLQGWMAEGDLSQYYITPLSVPQQSMEEGETLPPLSAGAYFLQVSSPETQQLGYEAQRHVLLVATVNITLKISQDSALVWVTDLKTGQPVPNVPLTLHNENFGIITTITTDENGLAQAQIPKLRTLYSTIFAVVQTPEQFGFAVSEFTQGIDPWAFNVVPDYQPSPDTMYLYTDRPIYRPGQPVYYRGIFRYKDDLNYSIPQNPIVMELSIFNAEGEIIEARSITLSPYGTFSGEFTLEEDAALGYYFISVAAPMLPTDEYQREYSVGFNVAEYRAPEFQVDVIPARSEVVQGEEIEVAVESRYFFGAPVTNAEVEWTVLGDKYFFEYDGPGNWQFIDYNYDDGPYSFYDVDRERIASGIGTTDAEGRLIIKLPAELGDKTQSQVYTIEATITDESDQSVSGRTQIIIHQGDYYIGLAPTEYVVREGDETQINVLTVGWDSAIVPNRSIDYRVVERRWSSVQEEDANGRTVWTFEVEEIEVAQGEVTTDGDGLGTITFTPPNGGAYKIYASSHDDAGNRINSSAFVWVSGREYIPWRQQNSNRIDLISDADEYAIGDTAEILITSPFQGTTQALITVERGDVYSAEVITLENNSYVYELPILEEYAPNIFVSVTIVKGVDETTRYPQFRFGLIQLNVETTRLEMNLEITPQIPQGTQPGPGDEVTISIKATDWQGNPVQAEVGVGVTDLAILTLAPSNTRTLLDYFYGSAGIGVRTANSLTVSVDQVTQTIIDTIKGGGGGGEEGGIFTVRQNFVDTPLWAPNVVTNENGEAEITVTLPDNLTTWRIDARAVTPGEDGRPLLVGQTTTDFISTKPLLIRPVTPRFLIVGDEATFGAIVNNNSNQDLEIQVQMNGNGYEVIEGETTVTTVIAAGESKRVDWVIQVQDVEAIDVFFAVQTLDGTLQDAARPSVGSGDDRVLPVYRYAAPETVGTSGALRGPESVNFTEVIALPLNIDDSRGNLTVKVDHSLASAAIDSFDYLELYASSGIEGTISSFLPNVVTYQALQQLGVDNTALKNELDQRVNFALQRLYTQQHVDGGWGWFPDEDSNELITAYALLGLTTARNADYDVDQRTIDRAIGFLNDYLRSTDNQALNNMPAWQINRRAFILYTLSYAGQGNASRLSSLYDARQLLNIEGKALLMMGIYLLNPDDPRLATLESDLMSLVSASASGAYWQELVSSRNWTTQTRATSMAFMALTQYDAENALLPNVVRWLITARKADAWETSQETTWAVLALTQWMVRTGELNPDYVYDVRLNSEPLISGHATSATAIESESVIIDISLLSQDAINRLSLFKDIGEGNLYYTAHLTTYQDVPTITPVSRGIIVNRQYVSAEGTPITSGRVGDEITVTLTIIAPNDLNFVVVEDPIPAGAEAVDPRLATTSLAAEGPSIERAGNTPFENYWGIWYFSRIEFRDEKVMLYTSFLPRGTYTFTYTLRLGLAGSYNVIPPTAREFYFPEVYGRGAGQLFVIEPERTN